MADPRGVAQISPAWHFREPIPVSCIIQERGCQILNGDETQHGCCMSFIMILSFSQSDIDTSGHSKQTEVLLVHFSMMSSVTPWMPELCRAFPTCRSGRAKNAKNAYCQSRHFQKKVYAFEGKKTASACSSGMVPSAGPNTPGFHQPTVQRTAPMDQHRVCRGLHPWNGKPAQVVLQTKQQKVSEKNSKFCTSIRHHGTMEEYACVHKHKHEYRHMRVACIREDLSTYPCTCVQSTLTCTSAHSYTPTPWTYVV